MEQQSNKINMVFDVYCQEEHSDNLCQTLTKIFPQGLVQKNRNDILRLESGLISEHPAKIRMILAQIPGIIRVDWQEGDFQEN